MQAEEKVVEVLKALEGDLKGNYYSLDGLSKEVQEELSKERLLPSNTDRYVIEASSLLSMSLLLPRYNQVGSMTPIITLSFCTLTPEHTRMYRYIFFFFFFLGGGGGGGGGSMLTKCRKKVTRNLSLYASRHTIDC